MRRLLLAGATFLLIFAASAGAQEPHNFQPGFNLFSKQQDVQLGEEAAAQVRKEKVDPTINAFALPCGHMFIHTGLLKAVENEAQLAGVMGHEMSHVILRHGTNQASKANLIQLPAALAGEMTDKNSMMGRLAQLG